MRITSLALTLTLSPRRGKGYRSVSDWRMNCRLRPSPDSSNRRRMTPPLPAGEDWGEGERVAKSVQAPVALTLTLTLSLREREQRAILCCNRLRAETPTDSRLQLARRMIPPLPAGESQGLCDEVGLRPSSRLHFHHRFGNKKPTHGRVITHTRRTKHFQLFRNHPSFAYANQPS